MAHQDMSLTQREANLWSISNQYMRGEISLEQLEDAETYYSMDTDQYFHSDHCLVKDVGTLDDIHQSFKNKIH
jgi:hypothetical protein